MDSQQKQMNKETQDLFVLQISLTTERFAQSETYWNQAKALVTGGGQPQFNGNALRRIKLPIPPFSTQKAIVAAIEAESALVNANRELIERFEKKIRAAVGRVWGGTV